MDPWEEIRRPAPESVTVAGRELRSGDRVRLCPRARRDAWDGMLAGRIGVLQRVEEDMDGGAHLVVTLADDPGRDLGPAHPGHAFLFDPDEVEPLPRPRILVAGIGNVFLGDDGFGCAVAAALADVPLPDGVEVVDFGIRGMDLAYALGSYDVAVLVDAAPLGEPPGTLAVIEPGLEGGGDAALQTHAMDPVGVLRLAGSLDALPGRALVVACQPRDVPDPSSDDIVGELSAPVRDAAARAVPLIHELVEQLLENDGKVVSP